MRWNVEKIALEKWSKLCHYGPMKPELFGLRELETDCDLPEEWQALLASHASTLAVLLARGQTTAATLRRRQPPAAPLQTLAAEADYYD
jgi:hypothetical protein